MKNVLVINLDDMSTDEWGALTSLNAGPFGHWVTFPSYVLNTSVCGPSRATMLSGLTAHHNGVHFNQDFTSMDTSDLLPVWVSADGITSAAIYGKYGNGFPAGGQTPDQLPQQMFPAGWTNGKIYVGGQDYLDFTLRSKEEYSPGVYQRWYRHNITDGWPSPPPASGGELNYSTDVITFYAQQFITNHVANPWFMYVAYVAPHRDIRIGGETNNYPVPATRHTGAFSTLKPIRDINTPALYKYDPSWNNLVGKPQWMQTAYGNNSRNLNGSPGTILRDAIDAERIKSWETLRAVDEGIIAILNTLSATGELDNTCIIITSDNGFAHGQHRHNGKLTPYDHSAVTQAMVRHPNAEPHIDPHVIGNIDIAPTVMHLLGKIPKPLDGESFAGCVDPTMARPIRNAHLIELRHTGGSDVPDTAATVAAGYGALTTVPTYWGIRDTLSKYIEWDSGEKELYDLALDPYELINVIDDTGYLAMAEAGEELLEKMKDRESFRQFPFGVGHGAELL